jgi:site-specific recombinase XerC
MVDVADLRDKAIILLMASSGMRLSAVTPHTIKEITPIEYEGLKLFKIIVYKKAREQ